MLLNGSAEPTDKKGLSEVAPENGNQAKTQHWPVALQQGKITENVSHRKLPEYLSRQWVVAAWQVFIKRRLILRGADVPV